jgi:WD40 repeat protein
LPTSLAWAFSPDSRRLAVAQQTGLNPVTGRIVHYDLATGQERSGWQTPFGRQPHCLAFSADGRQLAVGYHSSPFVSVFDPANGDLVAELPMEGAYQTQQCVAWHPSGERLAVGSYDPRIQIWNVAAKQKLATLEGHVQTITSVSFHPDGDLLASTSWDGTVRLWEPETGRPLLYLPAQGLPQFSNDGRWLGIVRRGEHAQLLEVTRSPEYRTLVSSLGAGQGTYNLPGAISHDGRLLAQSMEDAVRLWHVASGRKVAVLPPGRPLFMDSPELLIVGQEASSAGRSMTIPTLANCAWDLRGPSPFSCPRPRRARSGAGMAGLWQSPARLMASG